jgi:Raf kinase inhibitor-like YbhB/YbcL family protein
MLMGVFLMPLLINSPAFSHQETMPMQYTCEGDDHSPPLSWQGVPEQAKSLVLIVDDPDAPDPEAPKMTYVHWVLYNLPPNTTGLPEGVSSTQLPPGTVQGLNDWNRLGYGGPCPPIGRHRYFFKLYALDSVLPIIQQPTKAEIEKAMEGHIISKVEIMGTYQKVAH